MSELAKIRRSKGFSQRSLAEAASVSPSSVYEIETSRRKANPSTLRKLADALGVEVMDLLEEEERPKVTAPPEPNQERREELRNIRELLLDSHETLADWFDKYKADRDSHKLAAMTAITGYTTRGAAQILAESVGPPKDRESKRVYDALTRLDDLFEDIVQDLELRLEDDAGDEDVGAAVTHMREFARRKTA